MRVDLESVRRSLEVSTLYTYQYEGGRLMTKMSRELAESDLEGGRYIEQVEALSRDLQECVTNLERE